MSEHALLSASSAKRWLACPPSARLEETLPESTSVYAEEGTIAHSIGELKLRKHFLEPMSLRTFNTRLNKIKKDPLYKEEMLINTDIYLDYVSEVAHSYLAHPYVAVEKKLDYSAYAPEGFGTGDCILICGNDLHVTDYKNGKGVPVSAEHNPQMMLYALGAYLAYRMLYPIKNVHLAIVQPRVGPISKWSLTIEELLAWGESIKPIAAQAFAGEGEFLSGEHCKFCRANATCRARSENNTALEDFGFKKPPLITNEEVGAILQRAQDLAAWAKSLEVYALAETLKGSIIPGWKAVEGRGSRKFVDQDKAFKSLIASGTPEAMLYVKEPLSAAKVEELLGYTQYNVLLVEKGHIDKLPGKPTLAPLSDKREPFSVSAGAASDFKDPIAEVSAPPDPAEVADTIVVSAQTAKDIINCISGPVQLAGPMPGVVMSDAVRRVLATL